MHSQGPGNGVPRGLKAPCEEDANLSRQPVIWQGAPRTGVSDPQQMASNGDIILRPSSLGLHAGQNACHHGAKRGQLRFASPHILA